MKNRINNGVKQFWCKKVLHHGEDAEGKSILTIPMKHAEIKWTISGKDIMFTPLNPTFVPVQESA